MTEKVVGPTWKPHDIVRLHNKSGENIHIQMATGVYRLDAGRSMKFTAAILAYPEVKQLIDSGTLTWEKVS